MRGWAGWPRPWSGARPNARQAALAFGLGALAGFGHAPLYLWALTLIGLTGLIHLVAAHRTVAGWLGLLGGAGYGAVVLSWIVEPFLIEPETFGWMAPFALIFMALGLGAFWGAAARLAAALPSRNLALSFALTLTLAEHLRGHILTGFPWGMPGHVWISTPIAQFGAYVGPLGLTLALLLAAAALSSLRLRPVLGAGIAVAIGWLMGVWILSQPLPDGPGVTLRLVQPNAEQALKWDPDQARVFTDRLLDASAAPAKTGATPDLVIWPETALPYLLNYNPELPPIIAEAGQGAPVALGVQREEAGRYWNSLAVIDPSGTVTQTYDKHHLVPFGEYMPLGDLAYSVFGISAFAAQHGGGYTAGQGPQLLDFGPVIGRALPLICYEAVFPQDVNAAPERPDWLLHITNDAWFGTLSGPFQHADQARMRAIEQGLPMVRVANTGVTAVYDARGRELASLPFGTQGHLDAALPGALPATWFWRFGNWPTFVLLAGLALMVFRRHGTMKT
ncbi:apolipoprotein N-acyltransferase [Tabrizicola sp.]|uniref:apolipoprotein N-acyltransferase n=1 Tax=Tabrizicola sp. TaxID=2005166 RepID=UPI003D2DC691